VAGIFSGCIRARDNQLVRKAASLRRRGHKPRSGVLAAFTQGGTRANSGIDPRLKTALAGHGRMFLAAVCGRKQERKRPHADVEKCAAT